MSTNFDDDFSINLVDDEDDDSISFDLDDDEDIAIDLVDDDEDEEDEEDDEEEILPPDEDEKDNDLELSNAFEEFARISMDIKTDAEELKDELISAANVPEIATGTFLSPDDSKWILHDVIKRRRSVEIQKGGRTYPAIFYGYARDLELRPPVLLRRDRPVLEISQESPMTKEKWDHMLKNWEREHSRGLKARNDKLAQHMRKSLNIDGRDTDMLFFLWRFRNTPPVILAYLLDVPTIQVLVRLRQLKRAGLVVESNTMGGPLFSIGSFGAKALGLGTPPMKEPSQQSFNHNTIVSTIAAMAERGEVNPFHEGQPVPLLRPPYPKWNERKVSTPGAWGGPPLETDFVEGYRPGFRCVSESELRSAWQKWKSAEGFATQEEAYNAAKKEIESWDGNGLPLELRTGNEHLMVVQSINFEEHVPDLVVKMPYKANGDPQSICVEVEIKIKKDRYKYYARKFIDILSSGKYGEVHYFTPSGSVAYHLQKGADEAMAAGTKGKIYIHEVVPIFGGKNFYGRA